MTSSPPSSLGYFAGVYSNQTNAAQIAKTVPGIPFWITSTVTNGKPPAPIVPTVPNGAVILPAPDLSLLSYKANVQGWQYLINTYSFSPNVSLSGADLDSFATATLDQEPVTETPLLTVPFALTVPAGGSVRLGVIMGPVDSDDGLSVAISGVPSFESVSAAGVSPTVTKQGSTFTYTFNALPASDWNNGLILSSSYTGKGHPKNNLSVTVSTGESSTLRPRRSV